MPSGERLVPSSAFLVFVPSPFALTASICVLTSESTTGCYRAGMEEERERVRERERMNEREKRREKERRERMNEGVSERGRKGI